MKNDRVKSWHVEYSHREELARPTVTATANVPPLPIRWGPREMYLLLIMATMVAGLMAIFLAARQKIVPLRGRPVYLSFGLLVVTMAGLAGCTTASKSTLKGPGTVTVTSTSGTVSKTTMININLM